MAKKIYDNNGEFAHYAPGIIYDIGVVHPTTNVRTPFYVGETSDPEERLKAHKRAGKNADDESTLVYQAIRACDNAGAEWTMKALVEFGQEGPTDLEDEWIMKHLYSGYRLKNMKKGNANWMAEREACAADMRKRSISSYRKYKETLSIEEKAAEADRKHAEWMRQEAARTEKEVLQARAEEVRRQIEIEMAARRAEQVRKETETAERMAKIKAEAAIKWEADRPAREARMKVEAEERAAADIEKQRQYESLQRVLAEREAERMREDYKRKYTAVKQQEKASEGFRTAQEAERVALQKRSDDSMVKFRNTMTNLFGVKNG